MKTPNPKHVALIQRAFTKEQHALLHRSRAFREAAANASSTDEVNLAIVLGRGFLVDLAEKQKRLGQ